MIIHTNDLHSHFNNYPKAMTKIKELRADAESKGIEVLQVDAGDWGEGTPFYFSDQGADSVRALELFGVEVAAIGNHDHMLGGKVLSDKIKRANVDTKFVGANINTTPEMELDGLVHPYVDIEKAGIKIRVVGLTTSSNFFEYSMRPGSISPPLAVGEREARKGKRAGRELIIALTHLGVGEDRFLAKNSSSIDVIIGGHSHTKLRYVIKEENQYGKEVPIVQAASHGLSVGSLLLDVSRRGNVRIIRYKLHDINRNLREDPEMASFVEEATLKRNALFDTDWDAIIGETKTPITGSGWKLSCWGRHIARATREAVGADIGLHVPAFAGTDKRAGPVSFGDIVSNFPHIRKFGDQGWEIAIVKMSGWKIRPLMFLISRIGYGVNFSGLGYKSIDELNPQAVYSVAFPAEVAEAIKGSLPQFKHYLQGLEYTKAFFWPVIIQYVRDHSPIQCG